MQNVQETDCMRAGRCIGGWRRWRWRWRWYCTGEVLLTGCHGTYRADCCRGFDPSWQCSAVREATKENATKTHGKYSTSYSVYRDTRAGLARVTRVEEAGTPMLNSTEVLFTEC